MPSLRKIAEVAGVAPSTVTRALRDDPRISLETRRRIQALAAQYHYLPNRLTQSLVTGRSQMVGVLLPSVVTPYSTRMLEGILACAASVNYRVVIAESHGKLANSLAAIQSFIEQRVDGVILDTGHLEPIPRKSVLELRSQHVAPVGVDATTFEGEVDRVHTDEQAQALAAIDYLLHLGHARLAFVGRTVDGHWLGRGQFIARAFQQRLLSQRDFIDISSAPPYDSVDADALLTTLMIRKPAPTAIIAWEDPLAALLLKAAPRLGVHVPRDVSILGFGNLLFSQLTTPTLTTFEQHPETVGQHAMRLLLERINGADDTGPVIPQSVAVPPTLLVRESCAAPARR